MTARTNTKIGDVFSVNIDEKIFCMREIKLEGFKLSLSSEGNDLRVKSNTEDVILYNQTIGVISDLIKNNFKIVNNHYKKMVNNKAEPIDFKGVNLISIQIVLHYLYMYNTWINNHKNQESRDLSFDEKDFINPSTHDIIFNYFKKEYPDEWEKKCAVLLAMDLNNLKGYYKTREDFYNK